MAKHKPAIESVENHIENRLEKQLAEVRSTRINEPTIHYGIGQRVALGAHNEVIVKEILDNGKIYKVHIYSVYGENQQNAGKVHTDEDRYVVWHDLEKYCTNVENDKIVKLYKQSDLNFHFMSSQIGSLFHYYYDNLDMSPDYQRGNVWNLDDKVSLIDSIFNDIDIGKFVIVFTGYTGNSHYEILDGKQRLNAIIEFYENRFEYMGKTYYNLNGFDQSKFCNHMISLARVDQTLTSEMKYRYFLRLNTGGKVQDPKHIEYVKGLLDSVSK
jgi:hypothetical protein